VKRRFEDGLGEPPLSQHTKTGDMTY
jgi:hypothetical protein